jgi:O-antigen/teichoic acid export membrane protein
MTKSATKRVAYNTAIQMVGKAAIIIMGAVSVGILTRYLGPEGYGNFSLVLAYLSVFGIVADLGLFTIAVREISRQPARMKEIVGNTIVLRSLLSLLIFSIAIALAFVLPFNDFVKYGVLLASISQFFGLVNTALIAIFQARLRMDFAVLSDIVGRAAALGATITVVAMDLGFYAIIVTAIIGSITTFLVSYLSSRRYLKLAVYADRTLWKSLLKESLPLGAAMVITQIYFKADVLMISAFRTQAEVGIYAAAFKVIEILITIPGLFMNSILAVLMSRMERGADYQQMLQKAFELLVILGLGFAFGGLFLADEIMRVVGGTEFVSGADALRLLLFGVSSMMIGTLFSTVFVANNKQLQALKYGALGLGINIVANLVLIPTIGITGAAIATVISEAISLCLFAWFAKTRVGLTLSLGRVWKILLAAVLMLIPTYIFRDTLWLALPTGAAVYLGAILALRVIDRDVLRELRP